VYYIYIAAYSMMDPYSDEYYEGPLGLRNPKSAQHTHAAYLLGMGSMPQYILEINHLHISIAVPLHQLETRLMIVSFIHITTTTVLQIV